MSRRIGYYRNFRSAPDQPITIVAEPNVYETDENKHNVEFYVSIGAHSATLSVKDLEQFRTAIDKALEDVPAAMSAARIQQAKWEKRFAARRQSVPVKSLPTSEADTESV